MPDIYKYLGFGFVALLLVVAGAMIGAVLYETHISSAEPEDFWSRWQAIVGSFGVLAAIGVAIFTDVKVDRRFEKQIETQTELDRRADERQQAEWTRGTKIQERQVDNILHGLVNEITIVKTTISSMAMALEGEYNKLKGKQVGVSDYIKAMNTFLKQHGTFVMKRPIYEHLGLTIAQMPEPAIRAIITYEGQVQQIAKSLVGKLTVRNWNVADPIVHKQEILETIQLLSMVLANYRADLLSED